MACAPELFGAAQFARLLEAEGILAEHEAVVRALAIPGRQHARDRIADAEGMAEIEIAVVGEAQRERVGWMIDEYVFPDVGRADDLAGGPGLGGGEVPLLARRGARLRRLGGADRLRHRRIVAAKAVEQEKRGDRAAAEIEGRILVDRLLQRRDRIAFPGEIIGHRAIERDSAEAGVAAISSPCWSLAMLGLLGVSTVRRNEIVYALSKTTGR